MLGPSRFRFLSSEREICTPADWNRRDWPQLWLYNLHYFDDLAADCAAARAAWHRRLIARWIGENPPATGVGCDPYPTSLRIVNWIKWLLTGNNPDAAMLQSLAVQARWLARRIEWHLFANHLLANAKALVFAGHFFAGREAAAWLQRGLTILDDQLPVQILADGGHFERSPMYHATILEDLLDLINLAALLPGLVPAATVERWHATARHMGTWLAAMTHPDGGIAFFNDAALGIAPPARDLAAYAERVGLPSPEPPTTSVHAMPESGYLRVRHADATAILDLAPVGPDYQPGHAHADTLSFELSLGAERVIVNGGTSVYGTGPDRQRQRGTAAHSTVEVDGADSSEVWAGFRVARRARAFGVRIAESGGTIAVAASHDGYRRLGGGAVHTRTWRFRERRLAVADTISGRYRTAVARFHLHPAVTAEPVADGRSGILRCRGGRTVRWTSDAPASIEPSRYHPRFGTALPSSALTITFTTAALTTEFAW